MFITPYFGGCKYTNNFLFINKNPVFQCFGLLITPSASHFPFSSSLHILQNFFLQSPIPFRLRILLPFLSLFILHDTPSKLRPFLQVFRNSCHLFPRNHRLSWTAVTFFPQKPSQLCKKLLIKRTD